MAEENIKYLTIPLQTLENLTKILSSKESEKLMITSSWNLNETVAHLTGWAGQFRDEIRFLLDTKNQLFPWFISAKDNWAEFNDKNVIKYRNTDLQELKKIYGQINDEIIKMILDNKESGLLDIKHEIKYYGKYSPVTILQMIKMKNHHERGHLEQIREKLKTFANNK